ncbi:MAG: phosphoribosylglycinamide formyltransferase [Rhodocyclaceae bacterium]|jgi:phosphoribosylglycinamide formyltransferase-1|nr:phosphoribosylglycinamide formyltransferase [Rhodocyclaceae bacterium]MBK6907441.1 phosphoribosylglycinamide formyltransferase [Rhodocyclaceae bacterium]
MKSYVILISGRGSNMDALLDANLPGQCAAVISNKPDAAGIAIAAKRGIATRVLDHRGFASREAFDEALAGIVDEYAPHLILLAGFMRILTTPFVERYLGRLLNIHPSLLPAFPGVHTHAQALDAGVRIHGCTVHYVTPALDGGPIIAQAAVPVLGCDDVTTLSARVLKEEHRLYPAVANAVLRGQVGLSDTGRVTVTEEVSLTEALHAPHFA